MSSYISEVYVAKADDGGYVVVANFVRDEDSEQVAGPFKSRERAISHARKVAKHHGVKFAGFLL